MAVDPKRDSQDSAAVGRAVGDSRTLAASMPRMILEARRVAATVIDGLHRPASRRARGKFLGTPAVSCPASRPRASTGVGSARDDHHVRQLEWEAAHNVFRIPGRSLAVNGVCIAACHRIRSFIARWSLRLRSPRCWSKAASASASRL